MCARGRDILKIKAEYDKLTKSELEAMLYSGEWEKDRRRFTSEWKLNQTIFNDDKWNIIESEDEEDEYGY